MKNRVSQKTEPLSILESFIPKNSKSLISSLIFTFFSLTVVAQTINSAQNGSWSDPTTWVGGVVPTANDDVIVEHIVTNDGTSLSTVKCRNLTINSGGRLNQSNQLNIGGNLTILANGIFDNNPTNQYYPFSYTNIGTLDAFGNLTAADDKIVTVFGTLRLGYNNSSFTLGGRIVFNTGSTFSLEGPLNLKGWSGSTPQYLLDIDNLTNLNIQNGINPSINLPAFANGNTQRTISTGRSFAEPCSGSLSALVRMGSNNYFGNTANTRQDIRSVFFNNSAPAINVNFENTNIGYSTFQNVNVYSNDGEFSDFSISAGTSLFGDYTIVNHCNGVAPSLWASTAFDASNISSFKINVTDSAVLRLFNTQSFGGSFEIQNGIVIVKNGTLDLRNTSVSGLTNTQYFVTKSGGAVLLPAIGTTPITFNVGISIPNGNNPPTSIYAPVGIVSNSGNTNVTVNLETLTVPSGYIAPTIQWNITPSGSSPNLNITLTWPPSTESALFANNRSSAKIFHFNSSTMLWEELLTSVLVMNSDGSFSLTASNVVNFSPFAVMIPASVLSTELIQFSVKENGNQTEFNWQTASETNVKNFDIEKSLDGQKFEKIAEIKANNTPSVYQAFDHQFSESAYYRLKINDLDGTNSHSKTVFLEKNGAKTIKINRNTEGGILIETDDKIESVILTNNIGQVLKTTKDNRMGLTDLPTGIYIISVKTNKTFVSQKILNF